MLGFGIQNSVQEIPRESQKRLDMESKFHRQGIRSSVPGIRRHCAESRIQALKRLSWINVGTKCRS